jgi:hypothetical protein
MQAVKAAAEVLGIAPGIKKLRRHDLNISFAAFIS